MKNVLLYIALFLLIVLLFLPLGLRIFGKNLYKENEEVKKVVELLSCNKSNETISSTFLNSIPQNFQYKVKGNYLATILPDSQEEIETADKNDMNNEKESINENELITVIQKYSKVTYDDGKDISTFTIELNKVTDYPAELSNFKSLQDQTDYLKTLGFSCTKNTF